MRLYKNIFFLLMSLGFLIFIPKDTFAACELNWYRDASRDSTCYPAGSKFYYSEFANPYANEYNDACPSYPPTECRIERGVSVFLDANGNGVIDNGEGGMPNIYLG